MPLGYSTFTYDLTDLVDFEGDNVISVKVNHKDIADSRWFTGSGIYRDVYLTITDHIHIEQYGVFVTTPYVSEERATVAVDVRVVNETDRSEEHTSELQSRGHLVCRLLLEKKNKKLRIDAN